MEEFTIPLESNSQGVRLIYAVQFAVTRSAQINHIAFCGFPTKTLWDNMMFPGSPHSMESVIIVNCFSGDNFATNVTACLTVCYFVHRVPSR